MNIHDLKIISILLFSWLSKYVSCFVAAEGSNRPPPSLTRQISHSPQIALHAVENKNGGTSQKLFGCQNRENGGLREVYLQREIKK